MVVVALISMKVWVKMPELWEWWCGWQLNWSRSPHVARGIA
jgi:low affinity Fe/Cu permease